MHPKLASLIVSRLHRMGIDGQAEPAANIALAVCLSLQDHVRGHAARSNLADALARVMAELKLCVSEPVAARGRRGRASPARAEAG
jgi:hypothetical protein